MSNSLTLIKTKLFNPILASILLALSFAAVCEMSLKANAAQAPFDADFIAKTPPTIAWGDKINSPKAVILCIHGLGLHKGTYDDFGKRMASEGIPVFAIDVRGFGDFHLHGDDKLDLEQTMLDIKQTLELIRKQYPNSAVFLLGESMGGAIALKATALYPNLITGLISSVPSGDRFSGLGEDMKVGFHALLGGFGARFNAGKYVVEHASALNPELKKRWGSDPAGRTDFSPKELMAFQSFMNKNNETASQVKTTPVLVLQGENDKLVIGSGSYNVWDHLATPDPTFAVSKTSGHLIFEYGQFSPQDINYVLSWINKKLAPLPDQTVSTAPVQLPDKPKVPSKDEVLAGAPNFSANSNNHATVPNKVATLVSSRPGLPSFSYWIELMRDGKRYCCNNKAKFRSGDEIRIHLICSADGYAYILMKQGSSGAHAVLFPEARTGRDNSVSANKDYALPSATWLKFDNNPGTEKVSLIFSPSALDPDTNKYMNSQTVIVSADKSGAKDLCPTRMQISWDDPNPLIMPPSAGDNSKVTNASMVKITQVENPTSVIVVDVDLEHGS